MNTIPNIVFNSLGGKYEILDAHKSTSGGRKIAGPGMKVREWKSFFLDSNSVDLGISFK